MMTELLEKNPVGFKVYSVNKTLFCGTGAITSEKQQKAVAWLLEKLHTG